ncbi:hypothetical protein [Nocardia brasiliensis]|uniref:hypothetical protein n=1 Tax=Nocardia brasiliensis TaxID=37326 RepID=UPI0036704C23
MVEPAPLWPESGAWPGGLDDTGDRIADAGGGLVGSGLPASSHAMIASMAVVVPSCAAQSAHARSGISSVKLRRTAITISART